MKGRRTSPRRHFWRESDKSQGFGDGVPNQKSKIGAIRRAIGV